MASLGSKFNEKPVYDYINLMQEVQMTVKHYGINVTKMGKAIGMAPSTIYTKLDKLTFEPGELLKVVEYFNKGV